MKNTKPLSRTNPIELTDYAFLWYGQSSLGHRNMLETVAEMAMPESWGFCEGDMSILESYLNQTFCKLQRDGLVVENRGFAAFNTGLVTPDYDELYMCFEPNRRNDKQPWYCLGVCTEFDNDKGGLSQRLRNECESMPVRANYFRDLGDVVYDPSRRVTCNWDHIAVDNCDRLPSKFLMRYLSDAPKDVKDLLAHSESESVLNEKTERLREFLRNNDDARWQIRDALKSAHRRSSKRCAYCFRIAVPSYYPRINKVQTLLPLCLVSDSQPDVALVLGRDDQGNYEGRTILTLQMAYKNARLLCKPESSWLVV